MPISFSISISFLTPTEAVWDNFEYAQTIGFTTGGFTTGDEAGVLKMTDFNAGDDFSRQRVTLQMRHGVLDEEKTKKEIKMVSIARFVSYFWCSERGRLDRRFTCCFTPRRELGIGILLVLEMYLYVKSEVMCSVCSRDVLTCVI